MESGLTGLWGSTRQASAFALGTQATPEPFEASTCYRFSEGHWQLGCLSFRCPLSWWDCLQDLLAIVGGFKEALDLLVQIPAPSCPPGNKNAHSCNGSTDFLHSHVGRCGVLCNCCAIDRSWLLGVDSWLLFNAGNSGWQSIDAPPADPQGSQPERVKPWSAYNTVCVYDKQ